MPINPGRSSGHQGGVHINPADRYPAYCATVPIDIPDIDLDHLAEHKIRQCLFGPRAIRLLAFRRVDFGKPDLRLALLGIEQGEGIPVMAR